MKKILENLNFYFLKLQTPCSQVEIDQFEKKWNVDIPKQLSELLQATNGGDLVYNHRHLNLPSIFDEKILVNVIFWYISSLQRIESHMIDKDEVQNFDHLLYLGISNTHDIFFIGHSGEFKDKVYWSSGDPDESEEEINGKFIRPIYFLANSLEEFFSLLGPAPEME